VQSQEVTFNLFQTGFKKHTPITVNVAPDGSYHASVFNGNYQIIFPSGQGPFIQNTKSDTLEVKVQGDTRQDIKVLPYYMIQDTSYSVSGPIISADFGLKQIITDNRSKSIQYVALYISKTHFANKNNNVASQELNGSEISDINNIHLSAIMPKLTPTQDYVFAHIGVKVQNVEDLLFSKVTKLKVPTKFNDVTSKYLENYKQPFKLGKHFNSRRAVVKGWKTSNQRVEFTMYDGFPDRKWMSAEDWGANFTVKGGVWQTATLPAGKYVFLAKRGSNTSDLNGGTNRAYLAVAKGKELKWDNGSNLLDKADLGLPANNKSLSVSFKLSKESEVSLGYIVNFPSGELNAISFTSFEIIKVVK
jgi:hypothetical protein